MRITILAVGSRGDVQPYLGLGVGLLAAGHQVQISTHAVFEELVRSYGFDFSLIKLNPQEMFKQEAGQLWLEAGNNPIRFFRQLGTVFAPLVGEMIDDCWQACQATDAVIISPLAMGGLAFVDALELPYMAGVLQPSLPTREFPTWTMPKLPLGGLYNRMSYSISGRIKSLFGGPVWEAVNTWRAQNLGLPPVTRAQLMARFQRGDTPMLFGFSPSVVAKPADWPDWAHVTGYWFLDAPDGWQPDPQLLDFLADGPPPVYVGFGSMRGRNPEATTELVVQALRSSGHRGIILTGWGGLTQSDLPDSIFKIDAIPHDWLFPQMAAVVHHGGAGTTAAGLRAGVPSIVAPFFGDQPFWGRRVAELGVGPKPILQKRLTAPKLAAAITQATSDPNIRTRAAALGQRIRAEDGVGRAVEIVQHALRQESAVSRPAVPLTLAPSGGR